MNDLLDCVLEAHGGIDRWNEFTQVVASIVTGGGLWSIKGLAQDAAPRQMTVATKEEWASVTPYGKPEWRTAFTPKRIAIETLTGEVVQERIDPRESFDGHTMNTPWDTLQRAYFNGYALWTYLTTPFLLTLPGFEVREVDTWKEGAETWRVLRATFPDNIASHSTEQDFYFGEDFLLRRHDYNVDISPGLTGAQLVSEIVETQGIRFPTKRRAYQRGSDKRPIYEQLMVSIDLSNFRLT